MTMLLLTVSLLRRAVERCYKPFTGMAQPCKDSKKGVECTLYVSAGIFASAADVSSWLSAAQWQVTWQSPLHPRSRDVLDQRWLAPQCLPGVPLLLAFSCIRPSNRRHRDWSRVLLFSVVNSLPSTPHCYVATMVRIMKDMVSC
jgi:hypothetical protein